MNSPAYLATIDEHRRVWELLRLVIEKLQSETTTLGYMKISTQAHSPNKKTPNATKKAGGKRKTKRPSLAKKKK